TEVKAKGTFETAKDSQMVLDAHADIDLAHLRQVLPIENALFKKQTTISGRASVDAKLGGSMKKPIVAATVMLTDAAFSYPEKKIQIQNISGKVSADLNSAKFENLHALVADGKLAMEGTLENFSDPTISFAGTLERAKLEEIQTLLKQGFSTYPKDLDVSGKTDLELSIKGKASQPQVSGTATLLGTRIFHPVMMRPLSQIAGLVRFDNNSLHSEGMQMEWGSSSVRLSGKVEDLARFKLAFDFSVKPLDLTDISAYFLASTGYKAQGTGDGSGKITGPLDKMEITGTANIPSGKFEAPISASNKNTYVFPFTNFTAPFLFSDGILSIKNARTSLFSGTLDGSGKVFLRETPIRFQFDSKGKNLETQAFLSQNTSLKNVLSGPIDLTFATEGNTTGLDSWNGNWILTMKGGKYQSPPVVSQILSTLNLNQFASGNLTGIHGKFIIKNGRMSTDDLLFASSIGYALFKGSVGLDTSLSGNMALNFSQQAVGQSQVLQEFSEDGKTFAISTKVEGTLLAPSLPGFSAGKLLEFGLKRKGQKMLTDVLSGAGSGNSGNPASGTSQQKLNPEKMLLDGLQNIITGEKTPTTIPTPMPTKASENVASSPAAQTPDKAIEKEVEKELGKGLKNLFKF
ncbi:MAG: hypothetical protein HQM09_21265, partial [Candidatus Riflebacteria bacterium]|nr:hypothetical protein [Candidatus Riflebacteria bacterium]